MDYKYNYDEKIKIIKKAELIAESEKFYLNQEEQIRHPPLIFYLYSKLGYLIFCKTEDSLYKKDQAA